MAAGTRRSFASVVVIGAVADGGCGCQACMRGVRGLGSLNTASDSGITSSGRLSSTDLLAAGRVHSLRVSREGPARGAEGSGIFSLNTMKHAIGSGPGGEWKRVTPCERMDRCLILYYWKWIDWRRVRRIRPLLLRSGRLPLSCMQETAPLPRSLMPETAPRVGLAPVMLPFRRDILLY